MDRLITVKEIHRANADEKSRVCRVILDALPDWFGIPESIDEYEEGVKTLPFWAAYDDEKPIGFIALKEHNPYTAEIEVMGILSAHQRSGLGKRLVETAERYCRESGKSMLLVKTVDFAHPDIFYARTRAFYLALGFVPLQVLKGYWDEANPCLLLGKCLGHDLDIAPLTKGDRSAIIKWAETWDWGVGKIVAERLKHNGFADWETAFVATVAGQYAGGCILEKRDDYGTDIDPALTPFITAVYVDPKFRGRRLGEKILAAACNYARSRGFDAVYLISGEQGFYEKYGFEKIAQTTTALGGTEPVYKKALPH